MKHTKVEIESIILKLMKDIKREYYTDKDIFIEFENNIDAGHNIKQIKNGWCVGVPVPDYQFEKDEYVSILIFIDDDTGKIEGFLDNSMGRPLPLKAKLDNNGKYILTDIK